MPAFRLRKYQGPGSSLIDAYQNWRQQEPSVTDAPWEAPARKVASVAEFFMPSETDIQSEMPVGPAAPLISIFKNKAARLAGNEEFQRKLGNLYKNTFEKGHETVARNIRAAGQEFAKRYPRVAAHINLGESLSPDKGFYGRTEDVVGQVKKPVLVEFGKSAEKFRGPEGFEDAVETMFHEGAHVAQSLGNKDTTNLYNQSRRYLTDTENPDAISSYVDIPHEKSAFAIGHRAVADLRHTLGGYKGRKKDPGGKHKRLPNVTEELRRIAKQDLYSDYETKKAQADIREILARRGTLSLKEMQELVDLKKSREQLEFLRIAKEKAPGRFHKDIEPEETEVQKFLRRTQGTKTKPDYSNFDFQKWFNEQNKRKLAEEGKKFKYHKDIPEPTPEDMDWLGKQVNEVAKEPKPTRSLHPESVLNYSNPMTEALRRRKTRLESRNPIPGSRDDLALQGAIIMQQMHDLDPKLPNFKEKLAELKQMHEDTLKARRELRGK